MSLARLKKAFVALTEEKPNFLPGQVVNWKKGLKNKVAEGPFIVVRQLDTPIIDNDSNSGEPYFHEPLDLIVLSWRQEREREWAIEYYYDSRRMCLYNEEEEE